jgi:hypothetical protein
VLTPHRPTPNFPPSWNTAPTDLLPVVRYDRKTGERSLDLLTASLVYLGLAVLGWGGLPRSSPS